MTDDRLLAALGAVAREQRNEKTPPAELLTPPTEAMKQIIVARAMAALGTPRTTEVPAAVPAAVRTPARKTGWAARWWLGLGAPAALAAGVAIFVLGRGGPPLPAYEMEVRGGIAEERAGGEPDQRKPLLIETGSSVELVLRPATDAAQAVAARAFWVKGADVKSWNAEVTISPQGAVRLRGPGEHPFGAGEGQITAIVAPAGHVPAEVSASQLSAPPASWQVFRHNVRWR